ncbi:hypothetical protein TSUD_11750 [Trifolium subterraneum]|uniref:Protein FAR1-RELATED SEQUENCE n=1 Tax=Trifolium subterraneum TaxID=3900 RepID=A0A2Z6P489_TRISU|nr:hypothetical protein TSUD_11750 [Trifolium subterraneum]
MTSEEKNDVSDWHLEALKDYASNFLAFVQGKYPKTILTDQDLALKEAIAMKLPNSLALLSKLEIKSEKRQECVKSIIIHILERVFLLRNMLHLHAIRVLMVKNYFSLPSQYLPFRWRRESSLIPKSSHVVNCNGGSSAKFQSLIRRLEVESSKTKEREEVATRELEKVIKEIIDMPESEELLIDLEPYIDANNDGCEVENPIVTKSKGRPKGSRAKGSRLKGGVETAKKPRHCMFRVVVQLMMTHEIVQIKIKILKYCLLNLLIRSQRVGNRHVEVVVLLSCNNNVRNYDFFVQRRCYARLFCI